MLYKGQSQQPMNHKSLKYSSYLLDDTKTFMMTITPIFTLITLAVIFSTSTTAQAGQMRNQCKTSGECAMWMRCIHGFCGNPCEFGDQDGRATCIVTNHHAQFTCTLGHAFPSGSDIKLCLPVEWGCHGDGKNPGSIICNSPSWICLASQAANKCGNKEIVLTQAIERLSEL